MKPNLDTILLLALSPLLVIQTIWLGRKIIRLPEPVGPRSGHTGSGGRLHLLVVGDSSAAGVGVEHHEQALTPRLAQHLGASHKVKWQVCARNGATSKDAIGLLGPAGGDPVDIAYVIFGVNDVKNMRSETSWSQDMTTLIRHLRQNRSARHIVLSGLPPVGDFPLLPRPLRDILGMRARRFDRALQKIAIAENCLHLPVDTSLDANDMARDGFHPGKAIYAIWAQKAADRFASMLNTDADKPAG